METRKISLQQAAKDALAVQDACNLSGVAHSFLEAVLAVNEEMRRLGESGTWRSNHPIVRLYVDKLASLSGMQMDSFGRYAEAAEACRQIGAEGEGAGDATP